MIEMKTLDAIARAVTKLGFSDSGIAALRSTFDDVRLTCCLEDDMGAAEPFREYADFNLYLVDASEHCMTLTDDPHRACGVVVAEVYF